MFVKAVLSIAHEGCFTRRLGHDERMTQISSDRQRDILVLHAREPLIDEFIDWLHQTRELVTVVERQSGIVVVHTSVLPGGVIATIEDEHCTILWPATFVGGEERYAVLAPDRQHLKRLASRLQELGPTVVEWVSELPISALDVTGSPFADVFGTFSAKQLAVLRYALEKGYYESPRRCTVDEIAQVFGLARSTVDEHLRKAERRVLEGFGNALRKNPQLEEVATIRAGRPAKRPIERD